MGMTLIGIGASTPRDLPDPAVCCEEEDGQGDGGDEGGITRYVRVLLTCWGCRHASGQQSAAR
jgi:hypothetical protein